MARDVFLPVAAQPSVDTIVEQAQTAEELGYDRAWLPETWGRDAVTTLPSIAHGTEEIGIGTSIMPIYSRSAVLIGQTAATLQEVSDGRFRLGLGPSGPIVIENWHGKDFANPLKYTRETVDVAKQVLSGERVSYDGEYYDLDGFRLRCEPPAETPQIDAAGMGPKSVELAGRFADGWHALMLTKDGLRDRLEDFDHGADLGDQDRSEQEVTVSLTCCVDEDRDRARELVKSHLCFYIGGMGTFYRDAISRQGYEELANRIHDEWDDGDRDQLVDEFPEELLDELAIAGTPEECRDRIDEFEAIDGVSSASVSFPRAAEQADIQRTIETLAPEN